jgi:hypothetical protein
MCIISIKVIFLYEILYEIISGIIFFVKALFITFWMLVEIVGMSNMPLNMLQVQSPVFILVCVI